MRHLDLVLSENLSHNLIFGYFQILYLFLFFKYRYFSLAMASLHEDPLYEDEELDFSEVDPEQLAEFRRTHGEDDEDDGNELITSLPGSSTSSGKVRPLNFFDNQRRVRGKSLLKRSTADQGGVGGSRSSSSGSGTEKRVRLEESEIQEQSARDQALLSAMSSGLREELRSEMRSLFLQASKQQSSVDPEEWDRMRLEQRSSAIMSRAAFLSTEGAKAQFGAFAKIKASVEDARQKALAGDGEGVLAALDRLEHVADIRLEVIERADGLPGGWPAATIFERLASNGDANKAKLDRIWKSACVEAEAKKSVDSSKRAAAVRGKTPYVRGSQRGNYSFRSVTHSLLSFLCGILDHSLDRIHILSFHNEFCFHCVKL